METTGSSLALAARYLELNRPNDALRALDDAGDEALKEPRYWVLRSRSEYALRQWWKAVNAAQNGLALEPNDTELLSTLAVGWLGMGEPEMAERQLTRAVEIDPDDAGLLAQLAAVYAEQERYPAALDAANRAVSREPWSEYALMVRAAVAVDAEDANAERYVEELLESNPESDVAYALKGTLATRGKRYSAASKAFKAAAELDPSDQGNVDRARYSRDVMMHPLFAPLRPIWRIGWFPARVVMILVWIVLLATGHGELAVAVILLWLSLVALSYVAPPYVRWRAERKRREL